MVLCVDDEPVVLSALRRLLRHEPVDVRTTTDPLEALRILREEAVHVVIVDQRMPTMNGAALLAAVRQVAPRVRRVMLTAFSDPEIVTRCLDEQIDGFLLKPWSDEQVRRTVRNLAGAEAVPWEPGDRIAEIACGGQTCREVIRQIALALVRPSCRASGTVIILEEVCQIDDSMTRLFKELWRLLRRARTHTLVIERKGRAVAFWRALGEGRSVVGEGRTGAVLVSESPDL